MQIPAIPSDEVQRLAALRKLSLLDTPADNRFDRITRIAQQHFQVPIVLMSLVDAARQWFKSKQGLSVCELPRDISFCGHAILTDEIFCIPNALEDVRFADNPLVTGAPQIRFYAGAPLHAPDGSRVGTLCLIDHQPRPFTAEAMATLRDLADLVETELGYTRLLAAVDAAARLEAIEAQFKADEIRIQTIIDTVVDGLICIDAKGIMQTVNPATEKIFGYSIEEMLGHNVKLLMPEPHRSAHDEYLRQYISTGEHRIIGINREIAARRKDGSTFPIELAVSEMNIHGARQFVGVVRDISERKRAEVQLQSVTALHKAIIDSANFLIISTSPDGLIQSFNQGAERLLGYKAAEVVGRHTPALIHDPEEVIARAKELSVELDRVINPGFDTFVAWARLGVPDEREWTYIRKDGSRFPVLLSITAVWDGQGKINGFLGIASDITERNKIDLMKSEFISTVSHELRTPLTSIRGALGLVIGRFADSLPEKARRMLEMAERNSERLTLLINDILDLEKIESGRLEFAFKLIDLVTLAQRAVEDNDGYAHKHKVQLALNIALEQALVHGDENRLLQVFANLLSNAIKYSPQDGVVEVAIVPRIGGFRIIVKDQGPGISDAFRSRIFQRFAQADSSDTREKGGTGLGLSITKAIVERHEGRIDYESEAGQGTTFYFDLPAAQPPIRESVDYAVGNRVLICEGNADIAEILAEMLKPEGLVSDLASTAAAARTLLAKHTYRLLLLDLTLPDTDGLIFLQEVRTSPTTAELPVIVVSGRAQEERDALVGDALAVVDWLQKPPERKRLECAIRNALGRTERPHILHVEDDPDIVQIARVLLEDMADLTHVSTVQGARQQLADQDFDLIILDLGLTDGCGLDLLDQIKGHCPVIIFSAQAPVRGMTWPVAAMLTKSTVGNERLLATIRKILQS
jgi:PAS domain S-box-containing protein